MNKLENIKVIGFDADDTLWVNETYFREAEKIFAELMQPFETINTIEQELFKIEIANLPIYGYGIKGFILSMMETAMLLSNNNLDATTMQAIIDIGKSMLNKPVELLDGVEQVLKILSDSHRVILVTKGDLLDQERKLQKSGLDHYFHHIEVLSEKKTSNYNKLLGQLGIQPDEFLMIGNSLKSDVLPLITIGARAVHVPFHTTWAHEKVHSNQLENHQYHTIEKLNQVLPLLTEY